jgi:hypothetical protein
MITASLTEGLLSGGGMVGMDSVMGLGKRATRDLLDKALA